jgi:hypothetical protein
MVIGMSFLPGKNSEAFPQHELPGIALMIVLLSGDFLD